MGRRIRILVAEDDPGWQQALLRLYAEVLNDRAPEIVLARNGPEAFDLVTHQKFDLLSLDLNLGFAPPSSQNARMESRITGADGRSVLRRAYERKACRAVVVITGAPYDEQLDRVISEEKDVRRLRTAPPVELQQWFPGASLYLVKERDHSAEECVEFLKEEFLSRAVLNRLLRRAGRHSGIEPPYTVDVSGNYADPFIVVRSRSTPGTERRLERLDARIFWALSQAKRSLVGTINKAIVLRLCLDEAELRNLEPDRMQSRAHIEMNSMRRRLKKLGFDPRRLVAARRGIGWYLADDVNVDGLGEPPIFQEFAGVLRRGGLE
jgi:CheY-like chemotaxis protein